MDELVEKIARALFNTEKVKVFSDGSPVTWEKAISNCHDGRLTRLRRTARACLSAIEAEGMVIVPREPTEEMVDAGWDVSCDERHVVVETYSAMLAAAPKPPTPSATG